MIVANVDGQGHLHLVDRLREMVRLAAGLDEGKYLTPVARQRAIDCLSRFGQRLSNLPQGAVRAVGTNTLRQARNGAAFIAEAQRVLGHPIEIIAGREEARLVYLGVAHGLAARDEMRLVVDIGGGSTELIVGEGFVPMERESLHMGCVSMTLAHFPDGRISAEAMRRAETAGALEMRPVQEEFRATGWQSALGSSGTIRAIREVVRGEGWSEQGITYASLKRLKKALIEAGSLDRLGFASLSPERRPVFPGGVAVLLAVFKALNIEQMMVSDQALREGLLYDMIGRIRHEDVRDRTVASLSRRYGIDEPHAQRVEKTARALLDQVRNNWSIGSGDYADMLGWACRLHEIGLAVSHAQYQKHGGYILQNADMSGFSRQEQALLAALVRGHRRKLSPQDVFGTLPESLLPSAIRLCILLRLAVLLHRSRSAFCEPAPFLKVDGNRLHVAFPDDSLDAHPLTRAELEGESLRLKAVGFELGF
ncbi:MAG: Ppx/GppA family phosphatase [Gammaproteobacteria bacterium]|nr:Ppx/GppA family phosphatase [Gammaproteobacteria bacterium]MBU1654012.1 Ppx/GppA family phosphatase [Gammaproteobacteria bacterium]MBU1960729.1 Ppx/GppA family phosphatase [Gammaproteobacteria bacterium]